MYMACLHEFVQTNEWKMHKLPGLCFKEEDLIVVVSLQDGVCTTRELNVYGVMFSLVVCRSFTGYSTSLKSMDY